jgi:DNA-directed RNA polymerase subunit N (RpoN/RPB10)
MIIPIRCFTCGKVIADKWNHFVKKSKEIEESIDLDKMTINDLKVDTNDKLSVYFDNNRKGKILDDLGLTKICCRRHMLGHVDMIDII